MVPRCQGHMSDIRPILSYVNLFMCLSLISTEFKNIKRRSNSMLLGLLKSTVGCVLDPPKKEPICAFLLSYIRSWRIRISIRHLHPSPTNLDFDLWKLYSSMV